MELSEKLSAMLTEANITHNVLNAKPQNVERESEIVPLWSRDSEPV